MQIFKADAASDVLYLDYTLTKVEEDISFENKKKPKV